MILLSREYANGSTSPSLQRVEPCSSHEFPHPTHGFRIMDTQNTAGIDIVTDMTGTILESIYEMVIVSDASGNITYLNKAARELHGDRVYYGPIEDVPLQFSLYRPDGTAVLLPEELPLTKALGGQSVDRQEMIIKRHDGSGQIYASVSARPLYDRNKVLKGAVLTISDLTQLKHDEEKLRQAKDEAVAASEAKSRFLSTISHEVRTPLGGIIGLLELMNLSSEGELKIMGEAALESSIRLLQILNDLLDASKLQAGALALERRSFSIRQLLSSLLNLLMPEAMAKGLELYCSVSPDLPEFVSGDEMRVQQVLEKLLLNAIKFSRVGKVSMHAQVIELNDQNAVVKFSVSDTGIGISDKHRSMLFEPFSQAAESTTRVHGGTGMGLNICKSLVELMGGEIGVNSDENVGSTFWFILPFTK